MSFSVVIPTYNYANTLPVAIDSVLAADRDDVQVVVIDDASTDRTPEVIQRYSGMVEYVRLAENRGPGAAWAEGMSRASGDFVSKLDADDWILPTFFDRVEGGFSSGAGMVIAGVHDYREDTGMVFERPVTEVDQLLDPTAFRQRLLRRFFFRMPGVALDRNLIDGVGSVDGDLRLPHDWEFFLRVTRGASAFLIADPQAVYRIHDGSLTGTARRNESLRSDMERFASLVSDSASEGYLEPLERELFLEGLAETYLRIVGAQLPWSSSLDAFGHLRYAMRMAGTSRSAVRLSVFSVESALTKVLNRVGKPTKGLDVTPFLPPDTTVSA